MPALPLLLPPCWSLPMLPLWLAAPLVPAVCACTAVAPNIAAAAETANSAFNAFFSMLFSCL
jgi:hypothetical protein